MRLDGTLMMDVEIPAYVPIGQIINSGDIAQGNFATLAGSVNAVAFEPKYLQQRGTYIYESSPTRTIELEFDGQTIHVVQSTAPGTAGQSTALNPRTVKTGTAVRIARQMTIHPDEIDGIRELAGTGFDTVETRADRELKQNIRDIRSTFEYHRLTAAMGIWLDADGSVLQNYFTLLGVSQPTYDVTFGTAGASKWIKIGKQLLDQLEDALGSLDGEGFEPIVLCGRTFWEKFITQPDVVLAYQYFQANQQKDNPLRDDLRYADFKHGGLRWRQYRGGATNTGRFLPDNEAHIIADQVPGTYLGWFCPPKDVMSKVNKPGEPIVPTVKMLDHDGGMEIRLQSNPFHVMTRPAAAIKLFSSN